MTLKKFKEELAKLPTIPKVELIKARVHVTQSEIRRILREGAEDPRNPTELESFILDAAGVTDELNRENFIKSIQAQWNT